MSTGKKELKTLLHDVPYRTLNGSDNVAVTDITDDSRKVCPGSLFICIRGYQTDGHKYISQVLKNGATAIIVEDLSAAEPYHGSDVTFIQTDDTGQAMAFIAASWYDDPASDLKLIAVTGTKGKTTAAAMISHILNDAGISAGTIGTMGADFAGQHVDTLNTTPDAMALHRIFRQMVDAGCTYAVMETSSQGFKMGRTYGITFQWGLFLNISNDHISEAEHHSFEEYLACKMKIFDQSRNMIVNKGDALWQYLTPDQRSRCITFSSSGPADYRCVDATPVGGDDFLGVSADITGKVDMSARLRIPGLYNVDNALAAIALADSIGIDSKTICRALGSFEVEGRTQLVKAALAHGYHVIIDYSHNAMSMGSLLTTLRSYCKGKLICVFGARGNRTKTRRYPIGAAAGRFADHIVLTSDNLTDESFQEANRPVIDGIKSQNGSYESVEDRADAIRRALDMATEDDFVIITGKGHEHYQYVNGKPEYFSEEDVVTQYFQK